MKAAMIAGAFLMSAVLVQLPVLAGRVPDWEYGKLIEESDGVVIGTLVSREEVNGDVTQLQPWKEIFANEAPDQVALARRAYNFNIDLVAEVSMFQVEAGMKGEYKQEQIKVFHFSWRQQTELEGGPQFLSQGLTKNDAAMTPDRNPEHYMLFLDHREDGLFKPATGQYDSLYSIKRLEQVHTWPISGAEARGRAAIAAS